MKTLEDQKKVCCIYYMLSKVIFLGHCVKVKYSYQNRMEGVSNRVFKKVGKVRTVRNFQYECTRLIKGKGNKT